MIVHLEAEWNDAILEWFALVIAQHSLHFALQLYFILHGARDDYQPELPGGEPNPQFNRLYYSRCIKLLNNIERCIIYGNPRTHELKKLFDEGKISQDDFDLLEQADRRFNAAQITSRLRTHSLTSSKDLISDMKVFGGMLLYKRQVRTAQWKRKIWKSRFFVVFERTLYCYNVPPAEGGRLVRSMPLEGAIVHQTPPTEAKYPHMFEVENGGFFFRMRAADDDDMNRWIQVLTKESRSHILLSAANEMDSVTKEPNGGSHETALGDVSDLSSSQKARYLFFKAEKDFVRSLTDVAESLRFKDRSERKALAPDLVQKLEIPSCAYIPLCNSTDIWRRVQSPISQETRVFNTKERCPMIIYFLALRNESSIDHFIGTSKKVNLQVAEFLRSKFEVPDPHFRMHRHTMGTIAESHSELSLDSQVIDSSLMIWSENEERRAVRDARMTPDNEGAVETLESVKTNPQLHRMLHEGLIRLPSKIANRLSRRKQLSIVAKGTLTMENIPIVEPRSFDEDDENSVVSDVSGSILTNARIVHMDLEKDAIDAESLARAKEVICGKEMWSEKSERMLSYASKSAISPDAIAEIVGVMAKSNDDLRQEVFVMQMIHFYKSVFAKEALPLWLKTYRILSTSKRTGLIEVINDATSLDGLKKSEHYPIEGGLRAYFEKVYGSPSSMSFKAAQKNFMYSLVGYSLVAYLLGLKDRHNGNIMIDLHGHLIFIDFGFAFGMAPGHEFSFERAPFKLTQEYIDVLDGQSSECFKEFQRLFVTGFQAARKSSQIALGLVEIMMYKSNYPCFSGSRYGGGVALERFQKRLMLSVPDQQIPYRALRLIE